MSETAATYTTLAETNRQRLREYIRSSLYREPERGVPLPALKLLAQHRTQIEEADVYTARRGSDDTRRRSLASIVHTRDGDALGIGAAAGDQTSGAALLADDWRQYLYAEVHGRDGVIELTIEHYTVAQMVQRLGQADQQAVYDLALCSVKQAARARNIHPSHVRRLSNVALDNLLASLGRQK